MDGLPSTKKAMRKSAVRSKVNVVPLWGCTALLRSVYLSRRFLISQIGIGHERKRTMRRITKLLFGFMPSANSKRKNMSRKSVRTIGVTLVIAISLLVGIVLQPTGRTSAQTTAQAASLGRGEIRGLSLSADA